MNSSVNQLLMSINNDLSRKKTESLPALHNPNAGVRCASSNFLTILRKRPPINFQVFSFLLASFYVSKREFMASKLIDIVSSRKDLISHLRIIGDSRSQPVCGEHKS